MELDHIDRIILQELSKQSRVSLKEIGEKAGCSTQTVINRLDKIKEEIELTHTIELNFPDIGYTTEYFVRVNLRDDVLIDTNEIERVLKDSPYVQFAALTKGDFDLFIWSIAPSPGKYEEQMEAKIRVTLDKYIDEWTAHALLVKRSGFLPVDNEIIDLLNIKNKEKDLLKLLNENSRVKLGKIAEKLDVSKPTAKYHLDKVKKQYVKRFTSYYSGIEQLNHAVRFLQVCGSEGDFEKYSPAVYNLYTEEEKKAFNKLSYSTVVSGGMDSFFLETYKTLSEYNQHQKTLEKYYDKIIRKESNAIITDILKGVVPVRKIDIEKELDYLLSPVETD